MQIIYNGISYLKKALENSSKVFLVCDSSFPYLNIREDIEHVDVLYVFFDQLTSNPLYFGSLTSG